MSGAAPGWLQDGQEREQDSSWGGVLEEGGRMRAGAVAGPADSSAKPRQVLRRGWALALPPRAEAWSSTVWGKGREQAPFLPTSTPWQRQGRGLLWCCALSPLTRRSPTASGAAPLSWVLGLASRPAWFSVINPQRDLWPAEEQRAALLAPGPGGAWEAEVEAPRASGPAPAWPRQPWHLSGAGAVFGS